MIVHCTDSTVLKTKKKCPHFRITFMALWPINLLLCSNLGPHTPHSHTPQRAMSRGFKWQKDKKKKRQKDKNTKRRKVKKTKTQKDKKTKKYTVHTLTEPCEGFQISNVSDSRLNFAELSFIFFTFPFRWYWIQCKLNTAGFVGI